MHEAGIPAGVFNLVTGLGPVAGQALAGHPGVDLVSFTGSTAVGRRIGAIASGLVKKVALELGGKSANVILPSADLARAVNVGVANVMSNSGQTCSAWTRMLVHEDRYDEAVELAAAAAAKYGDRIGPLVSARQRERVRGYIEKGVAEGARLVAGGPGSPHEKGWHVSPTVFADVTPEMTIAQEEIFGPVLSVLRYADEEDALRIANGTVYGLAGAVWAGDEAEAVAFARRMDTGQVDINGGRFNPLAPSAVTSSPVWAANSARTVWPSTSRPSPSSSRGVVATMAVRAAVLPAVGALLEITGIELPEPGAGRVRVRLAAAGVCHSDLSLSDGTMRLPVPAVLGHEGAGTVVAVGEGVTHVAPGDGVVLNWAPSCGTCPACARGEVWLCADALAGAAEVHARRADDGTDLYPGLNVAAFAEETVVAASCVLPAPDGVPLTDAALLGCAVLTGYGAVHHSARVRPGERVAVFGVGEWASPPSSRRGSRARPRSSRSTSPRRRRSWREPRAPPTTSSPPTPPPGRSAPSPARRAWTWRWSASAARSPSVRPGSPPGAADAPRSSASAARTSRSPSTPWRSSTGAARSPAASTATPTPPATSRSSPATSAPAALTFPPWSPTTSPWTASPPPSTRCGRGRADGRWWCSDAVLTRLASGLLAGDRGRRQGVAARAAARDRDRDTATPARHRAPPTSVSAPGTSPSASHDISTTSAGTAYVVAPIRLAVVRARA
ncbi:hypothetical protein SHKM778_65800 [Streptomyces sp. KM77-8]|uniref:Aldehyde dehydrogenase family protein n=1 Tax=Streptomyces haneummycinicus TaxID=3074435 RepID=A0AAT9HRX1_9ACTN